MIFSFLSNASTCTLESAKYLMQANTEINKLSKTLLYYFVSTFHEKFYLVLFLGRVHLDANEQISVVAVYNK